jgi:hypothetical protein
MVTLPGSDFNRTPDYEQYATVRCHYCDNSMTRTMKVIVKMLEVDGYPACSKYCRDGTEQEMFEFLILFGGAIS